MEDSKIILINKEMDISSYKAIKKLKKEYNIKKVGHAGTLDPKATGLMIVMTNNATKLSDILMKKDKIYKVCMEQGYETDTLDLEGKVILEKNIVDISIDDFKKLLDEKFTGKIIQTPPMYSAIKVNGNKLYNLARKNKTIDIPKRSVVIYSYSDIKIENNKIEFNVCVSSGTYIRSLVRDIAYAMGTVATMTSLDRLQIANFKKPDSILFIEVYDALLYEKLTLNHTDYKRLKNGLSISLEKKFSTEFYHIFCDGRYCGIAKAIKKSNGIIELKRSKFFD